MESGPRCCQIRKAHSWHVRARGREGGRRCTPWYLPALGLRIRAYRPEKGGKEKAGRAGQGRAAGMGQNETEPNWVEERPPVLLSSSSHLSTMLSAPAALFPKVFVGRSIHTSATCSTAATARCETHPIQRYMTIHPHRFGGACRCAMKKKKLPGQGPPCPRTLFRSPCPKHVKGGSKLAEAGSGCLSWACVRA